MLFRSHALWPMLWYHSPVTETPRISSCVTPRLNWSTYGRFRFGSGLARDTTPKLVGTCAKLISQAGSVVKLQPLTPSAMSFRFLSFHVACVVMVLPDAGS